MKEREKKEREEKKEVTFPTLREKLKKKTESFREDTVERFLNS